MSHLCRNKKESICKIKLAKFPLICLHTQICPSRDRFFNVYDYAQCSVLPQNMMMVQHNDNHTMTVAWLTVSLSDSNCKKPWIVRNQETETQPDFRDVKMWGWGKVYLRMEEIWYLPVSKHGMYNIHVYKIQKCVTKISLFVSKVQLQRQKKKCKV